MQRRRKVRASVGLMAAGAVALSACGASSTSAGASASPGVQGSKHFVVGLAMSQITDPYFVVMHNFFVSEGQKLGITVKTLNANGSVAQQTAQVDSLISSGVNAIAISALDDTSIVSAIRLANQAHIPVFLVDTDANASQMAKLHASRVEVVESNNYQCGTDVGQEFVGWYNTVHPSQVNIGEVVLPLASSTALRRAGFWQEVKNLPNVRIVATANGDASYTQGLQVTTEMLQGHPDINVIYTDTGPAGVGVVKAIESLHDLGKVSVFGNSSLVPNQVDIQQGRWIGGATQYPAKEAITEMDNIKAYLTGHKVPSQVFIPCLPVNQTNVAAALAYSRSVGLQ